ncbi:MYG1 family protein [bacterium]|nr:MYG1 family protein [bacterium]
MKASTHDGRFHADEIFALALLNLFYPDLEIIRSRDENVYKNADIIVDVGHVYDLDNLIFDHHQRSFSLKRESGIPYASFGLVWKQYGELLCGSSETSAYIDSVIVQAIDADDNGIDIYETKIDGIGFHTLSDIIESFVPRHVDDNDKVQKGFDRALNFATAYMKRQIKLAKELFEVALPNIRNAIKVAEDPRILIFKMFDKTWLNFISRESKEALFVIFPTHRKTWAIRSVPKRGQKFEYCKLLPAEWGGRQKDFAGISDVHDALYCHNGCFLAEAKSLEGADKLAGIALEN